MVGKTVETMNDERPGSHFHAPFFLFLPCTVPPKITHVTSGGHLQVRKGSPVRLECSATGNPMPNITWTRKNNLLPNGEEQFTNPVYVIENMDRHKGGTYICTANNGVGQVATSQIILHVLSFLKSQNFSQLTFKSWKPEMAGQDLSRL
uniref:Ig-like domain-containing protein n=1 Tax=Anopheles culicifacies TaxID=139723 RepID=A0A182M4I9_9DIPT